MTEELTEEQCQEIMDQIPEPPEGIVKVKVEKIHIPHPYGITPKHIEHSSGMYLDPEEAERKGAECFICKDINRRDYTKPILSFNEHISQLTLFLRVPQNKDLNAVDGLHEYLLSIKEQAEELGIEGFAFPT